MPSLAWKVTPFSVSNRSSSRSLRSSFQKKRASFSRADSTRALPAAIAAPLPLDEPPGLSSVFHGLRAGGQGVSKDGPPMANSCVASLPSSTVPAFASLAVTTASLSGTCSASTLECAVVRMPLVE